MEQLNISTKVKNPNSPTITNPTKGLSAEEVNAIVSKTNEIIDYVEELTITGGVTQVDDNLTSTSIEHALSANQGRILNENKVNISDITNDITTGGTTKPLSAEQGKILKTTVDDKFNTSTGHDHDGSDSKQIDHVNLLNKGTNTHTQIDSHIGNISNPHSVTKTQVGLGNVPNLDTTTAVNSAHTHANKTDLDNITPTDITNIHNLSGVNTGDETNSSIKTKLGTDLSNKLDYNGDGSSLTNMTKSQVGLGNVDNTTDANKNVLSATKLTTAITIGTLTGDVVSTGSTFDGTGNNTNSTIISDNDITNTKLADMPTATIKGNDSLSTDSPQDLTVSEVRTLLNISNIDNTSDLNKPISIVQAAENTNLQNQINGLAGGMLGTLAFDAAAPTPAQSGYYVFTSAGTSGAWLGSVPVVKDGRVYVTKTGESYTYAYVDPNDNYIAKSMMSDSLTAGGSDKVASSEAVKALNELKAGEYLFPSDGINLVDPYTVKHGYYITQTGTPSGIESTGTGASTSDFVEVTVGETYYLNSSYGFRTYDANKAFVSSPAGSVYTVPPGVSYVRITSHNYAGSLETIINAQKTGNFSIYKGSANLAKQFHRLVNPVIDLISSIADKTFPIEKINADLMLSTDIKTVLSSNLIDPLSAKFDIECAQGSEQANLGWCCTGFIKITDYVSAFCWNSNIVLYDDYKNKITPSVTNGHPLPASVKYVRFYNRYSQLPNNYDNIDGKWFFGKGSFIPNPIPRFAKIFNPYDIDLYSPLIDKFVKPQTINFVDSINLINPYSCSLNTALNSNGDPYEVDGWVTTDFIEIDDHTVNYAWDISIIQAYDANKALVSVTLTNGQPIPNTVSYIRGYTGNGLITTYARVASSLFFGKSNSVPTPHVGYAKRIDPILVDVVDSKRDITFPFKDKRLFCIGDSFTMQGFYFSSLLSSTLATKVGDTGGSGNGSTLTTFAANIAQFSTLIAQADIITVLGGTNDYNHGSTTLGSYSDAAGANTIYGAVKATIAAIQAINANARIVFFTQPERKSYGGNPANTIPPDVNAQGINMYNISEAIYDCCSRMGIACCQTHHTLWPMNQVDLYTSDGLHPNPNGGNILGGQMGKFINSLL